MISRSSSTDSMGFSDTTLTHHQIRVLVAESSESELSQLLQLNDHHRWLELAVFLLMWPGGIAITLLGRAMIAPGIIQWPVMAIGVIVSAIALNAFVLLLHEGMHRTLLVNSWMNRWLGVMLGAPLLISFTAYQVMHLRHHDFLGDARDPDDYHNYCSHPTLIWFMHFMRLAIGAFLYLLMIPLLARRYGTGTQRWQIAQEYLILAALYVSAAMFVPSYVLLWGWAMPVVLVAYMTNIRGFTQHGITNAHDPLLASRSMLVPRFVSFLLLNENYHLEHHLFPEVPSYHLPQLHKRIWPRLPRAVTGRSYLAFLGRFFLASWQMDESPIGLVHPHENSAANSSE